MITIRKPRGFSWAKFFEGDGWHSAKKIYDDQGCVRESARRTEGDHMFSKKAVESSKNLATAVGE